MATDIPQLMLDEVRGANRTHWVVKLTDGTTTLQWADHPVASESEGLYKSRITSWGDIVTDLGDDNYSLVSSRASIQIYDDDRSFQHLIAESSAGALLDFDIEVWLRSFYVVASSHYMRLSGKVRDYRLAGNRIWEIVYGPPDSDINAPVRMTEINQSEFQLGFGAGAGDLVPDEAVGNPTQVVYGEHNSVGTTQTGLITAQFFYDDETTDTAWFCSWGRLEEVTRVFVDGTDETANATVGFQDTPGDVSYTYVSIPRATAPSTATVTFDCKGVTKDNTANTTAIVNPADILRHILVNFVFQEFNTTGAWLSETGLPIDYTLFDQAAEFFNVQGPEASVVFTTGTSGLSILNTFAQSFQCNVFWTTAFEIGILIDDYGITDTYLTADEHIRQDKGHFASDLTLKSLGDKQVKDLVVNSVFSQGGSSSRTRQMGTEQLREQDTINIRYGKAALV